MSKPRVFQEHRGEFTEIAPRHIHSVKWVDSLTIQPTANIRLLPSLTLTPDSVPDTIMIVPSVRETLNVPIYGPYEVKGPYSWDGEGYNLQAALGVDFAARFAGGADAALPAITTQIEAFAAARYEPFAGWTTEPSASDGPNVARLGTAIFAQLVTASLYNVSSLEELEGLLASYGLSAYMVVSWPNTGRDTTERLTIRPLHPLVQVTPNPLGDDLTSYFVRPHVGAVLEWTNNLPSRLSSPYFNLPFTAIVDKLGRVQHAPSIEVPDLFNSPDGGTKPSYLTRRINVGYRLLGVEEVIRVFHTGTRGPVIYRNPQVVNTSGSMKMSEELQRWNLQNTAATLTLRRFPGEDWTDFREQFFAPHQILNMPVGIFPDDWPDNQRDFVVREVQHEFTPQQGYSQDISGTLWQGPFRRLAAVSS